MFDSRMNCQQIVVIMLVQGNEEFATVYDGEIT